MLVFSWVMFNSTLSAETVNIRVDLDSWVGFGRTALLRAKLPFPLYTTNGKNKYTFKPEKYSNADLAKNIVVYTKTHDIETGNVESDAIQIFLRKVVRKHDGSIILHLIARGRPVSYQGWPLFKQDGTYLASLAVSFELSYHPENRPGKEFSMIGKPRLIPNSWEVELNQTKTSQKPKGPARTCASVTEVFSGS